MKLIFTIEFVTRRESIYRIRAIGFRCGWAKVGGAAGRLRVLEFDLRRKLAKGVDRVHSLLFFLPLGVNPMREPNRNPPAVWLPGEADSKELSAR